MMKKYFDLGINILFPSRCPICHTHWIRHHLPICEDCKIQIYKENTPIVTSSKYAARILSCRSYCGALRECIKSFKYYGRKNLIYIFEEILQDSTISISMSTVFPPSISMVLGSFCPVV